MTFSAKEAGALASKAIDVNSPEAIKSTQHILDAVKRHAIRGEKTMTIERAYITDIVKRRLEHLGFTVKAKGSSEKFESQYMTVSW